MASGEHKQGWLNRPLRHVLGNLISILLQLYMVRKLVGSFTEIRMTESSGGREDGSGERAQSPAGRIARKHRSVTEAERAARRTKQVAIMDEGLGDERRPLDRLLAK